MKVNGNDAEPGCYIAGHHGQYGLDELGSVAEQFGIELDDDDDPRYWRAASEAETTEDAVIVSNGHGRIGSHLATPEECMERQVWAADKVEEILNDATEGGYWTWEDGEFYLVQTEVESIVFVRVDPGETYDDAWQLLVNHGTEAAVTSYDQIDKGERAYRFNITVHYEPEYEPAEEFTNYEIVMGLDN